MAYTKIAKPKAVDYMTREQGDYLLLENGGRIILRRAWSRIAEPLASYSKIIKPAIP